MKLIAKFSTIDESWFYYHHVYLSCLNQKKASNEFCNFKQHINLILNLKHEEHTAEFCKKKLLHKWKTQWAIRKLFWKEIKTIKLTCRMLKLYKKLFKIQSFIVIQLWSDKTELMTFLHKRKISDFLFSDCFCEWDRKMSKHVMIYCVKHLKTHRKLKINKWINLRKMMFFSEKVKKIITWWLKQNLLSQFQLTWKLERLDL